MPFCSRRYVTATVLSCRALASGPNRFLATRGGTAIVPSTAVKSRTPAAWASGAGLQIYVQGMPCISVMPASGGFTRELQSSRVLKVMHAPSESLCSCALKNLLHAGQSGKMALCTIESRACCSRPSKECRPACVRPDVEAISNSWAPFLGASCRIRSSPTDEGSKTCRGHVI